VFIRPSIPIGAISGSEDFNDAPEFGVFPQFLGIFPKMKIYTSILIILMTDNSRSFLVVVIISGALSRNLNWRQNLLIQSFTWTFLTGPFAVRLVGVY